MVGDHAETIRSVSPASPFASDTWQWKVLDPRSVVPRELCWS